MFQNGVLYFSMLADLLQVSNVKNNITPLFDWHYFSIPKYIKSNAISNNNVLNDTHSK